MSKGFKAEYGKEVVMAMIKTIKENRDYLSEIDGTIGDGDHGINMHKGFSMVEKRLKDTPLHICDAFSLLGSVLLEDIGGSMGPLYGRFFMQIAKTTKGIDLVDANVLGSMLNSALDGVMKLSSVRIGDKTLIDTLWPATMSVQESIRIHREFEDAIDVMISSAFTGWQSTKDMIANVGRASRLGERSRGVLDAGATSCYLILKSMGESMKEYSI